MDGAGFFDDRHAHIWIVDAATGASRQLTSGETTNELDPQWSPDGTRIAFISERVNDSLMRNHGLYVAAASGGTPVKLSSAESNLHELRWPHDGRRLAYIGAADEVNIPKIYISPADGGTFHVTNDQVTFPTDLEWAEDDSTLYFTESYRGERLLFKMNPTNYKIQELIAHGTIRQPAATKSSLMYVGGDDLRPGDVFSAGLSGENPRQLTHLNSGLADFDLRRPERREFKSADKTGVGRILPEACRMGGQQDAPYGADDPRGSKRDVGAFLEFRGARLRRPRLGGSVGESARVIGIRRGLSARCR